MLIIIGFIGYQQRIYNEKIFLLNEDIGIIVKVIR